MDCACVLMKSGNTLQQQASALSETLQIVSVRLFSRLGTTQMVIINKVLIIESHTHIIMREQIASIVGINWVSIWVSVCSYRLNYFPMKINRLQRKQFGESKNGNGKSQKAFRSFKDKRKSQ